MRTLHELPLFHDRWSYLYLHYGTLDQDANGLCFRNAAAHTSLPINQLSLIMLGPGTTVTHAAVKALAVQNCLLAWTGEDGIKMYAHSTGGTFSARRLIRQAALVSNEVSRLEVAKRMFAKRFPETDLADKTLEQLRGMEGTRVRGCYATWAKAYGVAWQGREYDQDQWFGSQRRRSIAPCPLPMLAFMASVMRPSSRRDTPPAWASSTRANCSVSFTTWPIFTRATSRSRCLSASLPHRRATWNGLSVPIAAMNFTNFV